MADFDTLRIRAGYDSKEHNYAVNVPIYQTAAFDLGSIDRAESLWTLEQNGSLYTRVGGNPTVVVLEERMKALDGAYAALALASGMSAIAYTVLALTEGGGNIIASNSLYGGSEDSFAHFFPRFGASIKFVKDRFDIASYEAEIDENTRGIYAETISNPNAELYDIEALAELAHKHNIPLIVDNTVATPYLFKPFEHGADIIVYSATKAIGGHGNTIAGLILESGNFVYDKEKFPHFYEKSYKIKDRAGNRRSAYDVEPKAPLGIHLRAFYLEFIGASLSAFDAFLILQGLDTISERVDKQVRNAERIVKYLETKKEVLWIKHPSTKGSPYALLAEKYFPKGAGSILSFGFSGTEEQLDAFIKHLKYFSYHVNIGDVRSLIVNSPKTTHAEMDSEHLKLAGIEENTVRISAGLENADDLIADLEAAFEFVFGEEITVSQALPEDIDALHEIEKRSFSPEQAASYEAFLYRLKNYPEWFFKAEYKGKIIGLTDGSPSSQKYITDDLYKSGGAFDKNGENLLIYGLAVHPDYRHKGAAHKLMEHILNKAKEQGKTHVSLTCKEALIPFYESLGYHNHGISESVQGNVVSYDMETDFA
jgi:O-acetylhomoserine (thiol)-lyase